MHIEFDAWSVEETAILAKAATDLAELRQRSDRERAEQYKVDATPEVTTEVTTEVTPEVTPEVPVDALVAAVTEATTKRGLGMPKVIEYLGQQGVTKIPQLNAEQRVSFIAWLGEAIP